MTAFMSQWQGRIVVTDLWTSRLKFLQSGPLEKSS